MEKQRSNDQEHEEKLKTGARPTPGQAARGARPRLGQATQGAANRQRSEHRIDEEELKARARPKPGQATHVAAEKQEHTVEISLEPTRSDLGPTHGRRRGDRNPSEKTPAATAPRTQARAKNPSNCSLPESSPGSLKRSCGNEGSGTTEDVTNQDFGRKHNDERNMTTLHECNIPIASRHSTPTVPVV